MNSFPLSSHSSNTRAMNKTEKGEKQHIETCSFKAPDAPCSCPTMNKRDEAARDEFRVKFPFYPLQSLKSDDCVFRDDIETFFLQKLQEEREFGFKAGWKACGEAIIKDIKSK